MQAAIGDARGKRVLDAGCASGEHTALLLEAGAEVVAIDSSAALLALVQKRFGERVVARRADLREPLTFCADDSFDVVLSSLTLHYLEDWHPPPGGHFKLYQAWPLQSVPARA